MSPLKQHLERELRASGLLSGSDPMENQIVADLRQLIDAVDSQEHSGGSLSMVLNLFDRLVNFKPLTPLTGAKDEWTDNGLDAGKILTNVRCSSVLWLVDSDCAVDVGMKPVYVRPDGVATTLSSDPAPKVTFPYMPGFPEMIRVDEAGEPI